ncbi:MAG: hypothetical protein AAGA91_13060 [Pseudomonadota bacterium]
MKPMHQIVIIALCMFALMTTWDASAAKPNCSLCTQTLDASLAVHETTLKSGKIATFFSAL